MTVRPPLLTVGLTRLNDQGAIDQPAVAQGWKRPRSIRIQGDVVLWDDPPAGPFTRLGNSTLDDFVRLAKATPQGTPQAIKRFITRWGVLGICHRHGLPHALAPIPQGPTDEPPCRADTLYGPYQEPLESYRVYARQALTIIEIKRKVLERRKVEAGATGRQSVRSRSQGQSRAVPKGMWEVLDEGGLFYPRLRPDVDMTVPNASWYSVFPLHEEQTLLAEAVQKWLRIGRVEPRMTWKPDKPQPEIELGAGHLFGGLAVALALQVTGMAILPTCEECGTPFRPLRRDERVRWCPNCRPTASKRDQQRRRRARRRQEATA